MPHQCAHATTEFFTKSLEYIETYIKRPFLKHLPALRDHLLFFSLVLPIWPNCPCIKHLPVLRDHLLWLPMVVSHNAGFTVLAQHHKGCQCNQIKDRNLWGGNPNMECSSWEESCLSDSYCRVKNRCSRMSCAKSGGKMVKWSIWQCK